MPGASGIRGKATRKMSLSRRQDYLRKVSRTLLQTGNEDPNPHCDAVLRPQDDLPASGNGNSSSDGWIEERAES